MLDVAYLGMVPRFTVEMDDGRTMTAVRQNRSTGAERSSRGPAREVTVSWNRAAAFALPGAGHAATASIEPLTKEQHE